VCASVEFVGDNRVEVRTEAFEGDIVIPPSSLALPLPFFGENVHEPSTELGASFLHRKKLLTVNGTHTTLAFLTLITAEPETVGPPQGNHELLKFDAFEAVMFSGLDTVGRDCWVWTVARLLMLVSEFSEEVVHHTIAKNTTFGRRRWHQVAAMEMGDSPAIVEGLLHEARTALQRLSGGGDETARVLGGGVDNRFNTRLANVAEYFHGCEDFTDLQKDLLEASGVSEVELRSRVEYVVRESSRFVVDTSSVDETAMRWGLTPKKPMTTSALKAAAAKNAVGLASVAVLFDFDGTLANTELPAMEVAFWTLAPYLPNLDDAPEQSLSEACADFSLENAGKPFEHMIADCDKERSVLGLLSVEETRSEHAEAPALLQAIDVQRDILGLVPISVMRQNGTEPPTLLKQQKLDTEKHLSLTAQACPGVAEALDTLNNMGTPFTIATTSGKPRVPLCIDASGLRPFFPHDEKHIHSGESDFDPPCFKPSPEVYLRAAGAVKQAPVDCVAVEDSVTGVGSAANAKVGLIVGYVGGQHISPEMEEAQAKQLMQGSKSVDGRGADIVITHMFDLPMIIESFAEERTRRGREDPPLWLKRADFSRTAGTLYIRELS